MITANPKMREKVFSDILDTFIRSADPLMQEEIFRHIAATIARHTGTERVVFAKRIDRERYEVVGLSRRVATKEGERIVVRLSKKETPFIINCMEKKGMAAAGRKIVKPDAGTARIMKRYGVASGLIVPLRFSGKLIGVLAFLSSGERVFGPEEIMVARLAAEAASPFLAYALAQQRNGRTAEGASRRPF